MLSELPERVAQGADALEPLNRRKKIDVDGKLAPDRNEEYLLYQTLLGAWPFETTDDGRPTTDGATPSVVSRPSSVV